jgi:hypothetical protein
LRVIDDLERLEILQTIMEELPHDSSIKLYDSYNNNINRQLLDTWNLLREQQLSAEDLRKYVNNLKDDSYFKECFPDLIYKSNTKNGNKGDIKTKDRNRLFEQWEKLLEVADLQPVY